MIVPHGTTATISDSHEIGNVLGVPGIDMLIDASEGLPLDLFFMASSCVPATSWEDAGAVLGPAEVADLLTRPKVLGLAEVMDMPAVWRGDPDMLEKILAAAAAGAGDRRPRAGRRPGSSCSPTWRRGFARITSRRRRKRRRPRRRLGMLVQIRDGSIARNLDAMLPLLAAGELGDRWTLVHRRRAARRPAAIGPHRRPARARRRGGVPGVRGAAGVVRPRRPLRPERPRRLAAGYRADLVVVDDLRDFRSTLSSRTATSVPATATYLAETRAATLSRPTPSTRQL